MSQPMDETPLLSVRGLTKHFTGRGGQIVHAVEDVSFDIRRGTTVGLVGESGSGKTTAGRSILRLVEPSGGRAIFDGTDIFALKPREMKHWRKRLQIVFQDPYSSLNPRLRIDAIIGEALDARGYPRGAKRRERISELLTLVGLSADYAKRFPHEFSGGQRQRIGIARALAVEPDFIVADEPVSALDVSVRAQILNLLLDLQEERGVAYLFISHDLAVVRALADRMIVMDEGRIVESGGTEAVLVSPLSETTRSLIQAVPRLAD